MVGSIVSIFSPNKPQLPAIDSVIPSDGRLEGKIARARIRKI
jgi:hypothetical protein